MNRPAPIEPADRVPSADAAAGVGHSSARDPREAARAAIRGALGDAVPAKGDLVLIFPSVAYDLPALHRAALAEAAPASVVGATTVGAFTHAAQLTHGCVAAWIPGTRASLGIAHVPRADGDVVGSTRRAVDLARVRAGERHPHSALLLLSDGLTDDQQDVVRGAYAITGATVPLVGGAAGDDLRWERTYTFGEEVVRDDGIVAVWMNSPHPLGVGVGHGWRPVGPPLVVSRAEGRLIHELDGHPAAPAYLRTLGERPESPSRPFDALTMDHPLGLATVNGDHEVRHVVERRDDALLTLGHVPDQAVVQIMASSQADLLAGAETAARHALDALTTPARVALVFSCAGRLPLLGSHRAAEVQAISRRLGGIPAAGLFTTGEFARVVGPSGYHNATVSVLVI